MSIDPMTPPSDSAPAVALRGLTKYFGQQLAVGGINLDVPVGSFVGLVGPNGAGKSTTLAMITGLLRPDAGTVFLHGHDVWQDPQFARQSIGVVPEDLRLFERLSGRELLEYSGRLRSIPKATTMARAEELLVVLGLADDAKKLVVDYSSGMRKKIALASALIHSPSILFLDEPFESVDPVSARTMRAVLGRLTDTGATVVFSSHVMDLVERLCDRVAILHQGFLVAEGPTAQVCNGMRLEDRFASIVGVAELSDTSLQWLHGGQEQGKESDQQGGQHSADEDSRPRSNTSDQSVLDPVQPPPAMPDVSWHPPPLPRQ